MKVLAVIVTGLLGFLTVVAVVAMFTLGYVGIFGDVDGYDFGNGAMLTFFVAIVLAIATGASATVYAVLDDKEAKK